MIDREYAKTKTIVIFTLCIQLCTGILLAGIVYIYAPWIANVYFHAPDVAYLLQYFCIYFVLINFFQVMGSLFVSTQQIKRSQGIEVARMRTIVA